ncbi:MAG: CHASE2 domain-containing protein, partial [bacterium]|nr:CHASE2 domain-containing protein [bacterium]
MAVHRRSVSLRHTNHRRNLVANVCLAAVSLLLAFAFNPITCLLEMKSLDLRYRVSPPASASSEIMCVDIDDASIEQLGRWPWPRKHLADVITCLSRLGAKAVVLDGFLSAQTDPENDQALVDAIRDCGNVFSGLAVGLSEEGEPVQALAPQMPVELTFALSRSSIQGAEDTQVRLLQVNRVLPLLQGVERYAAGLGHIALVPDDDAVNRRTPLIVGLDGAVLPSLSLLAAMDLLDAGTAKLTATGIVLESRDGADVADDWVIPVDGQGQLLINYAGGWGEAFLHFSFADLLAAADDADAGRSKIGTSMQGKTVLVAASFTGGTDIGSTPLQNGVPLSTVLCNAINTIVTGQYLVPVHPAVSHLLSVLGLFALLVSTVYASPRICLPVSLGLVGCYVALGCLLFRLDGVVMPVVEPSFVVFAAAILMTARSVAVERREKAQLRTALARHMPEPVVAELLRNPGFLHADGERKELTILVASIADFDALVTGADPEDAVALQRTFYDTMCRVVRRHGGTVDTLAESRLLAYFGHPFFYQDHTERAVRAAQDAIEARGDLTTASARFASRQLSLRVGVEAGFATVGSFGAEPNVRYTVIGDRVSVARRLEEQAGPSQVCASEDTLMRLANTERWYRKGTVECRGRALPVYVLDVTATGGAVGPRQESTVLAEVPWEYRGPFRIVAKIGQGGMAAVFKAYDEELHRFVAIKEPLLKGLEDDRYIDRFVAEARVLAKVNHPRIVQIYSIGNRDGVPFIAMEYIEGCALNTLVEREGPIAIRRAVAIIRDTAEGLAAAHQQGIIHRDVKPANILVAKTGDVKVADFGLSKTIKFDGRLSATSRISGTPLFMSPEQARGELLDHRTDIYALGITAYFLLTGQPPFQSSTPYELLNKHVNEPLPAMEVYGASVPRDVENLVNKMAAKDPNDRYDTYEELAAALSTHIQALPEPAPG